MKKYEIIGTEKYSYIVEAESKAEAVDLVQKDPATYMKEFLGRKVKRITVKKD